MPKLIIIQGVDQGQQFDLVDAAVVGRHSNNAIPLHDSEVSRKHFELRIHGGRTTLHDLGSGNGTQLNGRRVTVAELRNGDQIRIGGTVLLFSEDPIAPRGTSTAVHVSDAGSSRLSGIVRSVPADRGSVILSNPTQVNTPWLRTRLANLAILYEAANVVSHVLDVDELLGRILELMLPNLDADQGCFLLKDTDTGELMPKAIRSRPDSPSVGKLAISRTIVDHVLRESKGVLVADAAADARFAGGESIAKHSLREVLCVPMRGRHETVGALFLDTRTDSAEGTHFSDEHLHLAIAIAHQAALAVEETRYYQALVNAERLAAVGQTIAGMSHHIKNIMHGVRFGSDMVRLGLAENDRELLHKGWKLVERNQSRIDELILDMLNFSKEREPAIEPTNLVKVIEDVFELQHGRATERGVKLDFVAPPSEFPLVPCDPEGIHRALLNLVTNAIDAVADQGDGVVCVTLSQHADAVELHVCDNGPGIPPELHDEVFKPFMSSKGNRGTGLGLPVSRKVLREHGGDLTVTNRCDGGCEFVMRLPRSLKSPHAN